MKIFASDRYAMPLPHGHTFPMDKYRLLGEAVRRLNLVPHNDIREPCPATDEEILRVHTADYLERLEAGRLTETEVRRIGLPWSSALVARARTSAGATLDACRASLNGRVAVNLGGGTHHAFPDHGQGYCVLNDAAIAVRALQAEGAVARMLIVDCDVHQGNGTAFIFRDDPRVFTFSIHGDKNFPLRKGRSDIDVALADGTGDADYLAALAGGLAQAVPAARAELVIYLAGADPFREDRFGRLKLSREGLLARDRLAFESCHRAGLPVAVTMAGGYAPQVEDIVAIHLNTIRAALEFERVTAARTGR